MFNVEFLNELRKAELEAVLREFRTGSRLLEFGAGTGAQAKILDSKGYDVIALDMTSSGYSYARVFPIIDYDGSTIPLDDSSVDTIYSSNVLEHVGNFSSINEEFLRILKPDGYCVHIMPSVAWRAWTFATGFVAAFLTILLFIRDVFITNQSGPKSKLLLRHLKTFLGAIIPMGHGTSWEGISELWTFSETAWRLKLAKSGFQIIRAYPIGIFHTGHMIFGSRIPIDQRKKLSKWLGSAATVYVVRAARV